MIHVGGNVYEVVKENKNGWNLEAFRNRYSEVLDRYDYVVGDWGYNQLRLRGFLKEGNPRATKDTSIAGLEDYINEYCNFGCAYFILEKVGVSADHPETMPDEEADELGERVTDAAVESAGVEPVPAQSANVPDRYRVNPVGLRGREEGTAGGERKNRGRGGMDRREAPRGGQARGERTEREGGRPGGERREAGRGGERGGQRPQGERVSERRGGDRPNRGERAGQDRQERSMRAEPPQGERAGADRGQDRPDRLDRGGDGQERGANPRRRGRHFGRSSGGGPKGNSGGSQPAADKQPPNQ